MASKKILYVSGVGGLKEDFLHFEFSTFGYIKTVQKKQDQGGGHYAFIEFESEEAAAAALDNMDGTVIDNKTLFCSYSNRSPATAYSNTAIWSTEEGGVHRSSSNSSST
jgi:RNA recognition motif-containing protein